MGDITEEIYHDNLKESTLKVVINIVEFAKGRGNSTDFKVYLNDEDYDCSEHLVCYVVCEDARLTEEEEE